MRKDRTGIIFLIIALFGFVLVKVVPLVYSPTPTHETGKIKIKSHPKPPSNPKFVKQGNAWFKDGNGNNLVVINVEFAESKIEITNGLMYRSSMEENQGMLFIFTDMDKRSFWMKNTSIPLDIIFIRKNGTIDSYYKKTQPNSLQPLPSVGEAKYVLEVNGGFMDKYGINETTKFDFNKNKK